ncbi:hypothetical protein HUJ04_005114 [Dendroctonus ponderosae]|nr:hypothetical protein HUJ04_005114 [Dendroctonus ponderosae]
MYKRRNNSIKLPPPPNIPFEDTKLPVTQKSIGNGHVKPIANGCATIIPNGNCATLPSLPKASSCTSKSYNCTQNKHVDNYRPNINKKSSKYENDHTVLAGTSCGVVMDWGHGWGWTAQTPAIAPQITFTTEALSSSLYCHAVEDYTMVGYDDVDWNLYLSEWTVFFTNQASST